MTTLLQEGGREGGREKQKKGEDSKRVIPIGEFSPQISTLFLRNSDLFFQIREI